MPNIALNVAELRNGNRFRILEILRFSPMGRAELSRKTGLAKSSVTTLTNQMIEEGLIKEFGIDEKNSKAGSKSILLGINHNFGFALGINLHRKKISVSAVDLTGNLLFEFFKNNSEFSKTTEAVNFLVQQIPLEIKKAGLDISRLVGIGVSAPGPLDCENGVILEPPNFPLFNNFPILKELKERFNCPAFLENDAVTLAIYEHHYIEQQNQNTLFVSIFDGIGGALIKNGEVYRGSHGIAGELGHISVDPKGAECPCGNRGCLEQYATLSSLKQRFGIKDYPSLVEGFISQKRASQKAFLFLVDTLSSALVGAVNLFDLDKIIIRGEFDYKPEVLCQEIEKYIKARSVVCKVHSVKVVPSGQKGFYGHNAAAVLAINGFFKESNTLCSLK